MALTDTAEYWQDVKRQYTGQNYYCIPNYDCGFKHYFEAKYVDDVNCRACKEAIKNGYAHGLKSAEEHKRHDEHRAMQKTNSIKAKWVKKYPNNPICECGFVMLERTNKSNNNLFWGCSQYPNCKCTRVKAEKVF